MFSFIARALVTVVLCIAAIPVAIIGCCVVFLCDSPEA